MEGPWLNTNNSLESGEPQPVDEFSGGGELR